MMERSLQQERDYWDQQIVDSKRVVQETQEFANAFANLAERIESVEPTSPISGNAQRYVLNYCEEMRGRALVRVAEKQQDVLKLQASRP